MIIAFLDEPWNNPQFVIEVKGGSAKDDCAILASVALKCKMQDRVGIPGVRCFKINDPSAWPENKFSEDFFLLEDNSTEYKPPPKENPEGVQCFEQRVSAANYAIVNFYHDFDV